MPEAGVDAELPNRHCITCSLSCILLCSGKPESCDSTAPVSPSILHIKAEVLIDLELKTVFPTQE